MRTLVAERSTTRRERALAAERASVLPWPPQREVPGARARLEAMLAEPAAHRFAKVRLADLGEPGCGAYRVALRPRLATGWWRVILSSGCP